MQVMKENMVDSEDDNDTQTTFDPTILDRLPPTAPGAMQEFFDIIETRKGSGH